ncbi:hypothetical protein ALC57_08627, partial [Trachymyrmex cornetzi]
RKINYITWQLITDSRLKRRTLGNEVELQQMRKTENVDNKDVESAAELRYSAIINPLRGGHIGAAWRFVSLPYSGPSRLPPVGRTPGTVVPLARNTPVIPTGYRLEGSRGAQLTMKYVHRKSGVLYQRGGGW